MGNENINWDAAPVAHPPVAEAPTVPTAVAEQGSRVAEAVQRRRSGGRGRKAVLAVTALALAGSVPAAHAFMSGDNEQADMSNGSIGATGQEPTGENACPDGFAENPYQASLEISTPGDLHRQPAETMNTAADLNEYLFGENGVLCDSVTSLAVFKRGILKSLGEGAAEAHDFQSFDTVDEQMQIYLDNPEARKKDVQMLSTIVQGHMGINTQEIPGGYFKASGVKQDETVKARLVRQDTNLAADTVFVIFVGGDNNLNGNDIIAVDRTSGQFDFLDAEGVAPEISPEEKAQQDAEAGGQGGIDNTESEEGTGVDTGTQSEANPNGPNNGPGTNNTPEATTGVDNTPNSGSGGPSGPTGPTGGPSGPSGPTGPTTPETTPPATQPPTTPPPTRPPETVPPTTQPPETVPTTPPPTYKDSPTTIVGTPNGMEVPTGNAEIINGVKTQIVDGKAYVTIYPNQAQ